MDDGRNDGDQKWEAGFDRNCGEGAQLTVGLLGVSDEIRDFGSGVEQEGGQGVSGWKRFR